MLTTQNSARSLPSADPDLGLLVATERRAGDGTAASYAPQRRRWFAKLHAAASGPLPSLGALDVALSPEWVRAKALPPTARAALARAFADMAADWESAGRVVGRAGDHLEIATLLPGVLALGSHPAAAFLVPGGEAPAVELRLERVVPLQRRGPAPYADRTGRLPTPVPVSLSLRAAQTLPAGSGRLLLLTDDGIGRIALREEAPPP